MISSLTYYIARTSILSGLSQLKVGNFQMSDDKNNVIISVVNDKTAPVPKVIVYNQKNFFISVFLKNDCGLGESYVRGEWVCDDLTGLLTNLALNLGNQAMPKMFSMFINSVKSISKDYDEECIKTSYDEGNDFYFHFLKNDLLAYTCGFYSKENRNPNDAQYKKINTIIQKMDATPGMYILDIGCGWGKVANYVAQETKCKVKGITISQEQAKYVSATSDPEKVEVEIVDYRNVDEKFDRMYIIGMIEHIRYENYDAFFKMIKRNLKPGGRCVLHTIVSFDIKQETTSLEDSFTYSHIFPGSQVPQHDWIIKNVRDNNLNVIHYEGFGGQHYARTLKDWREGMWAEKENILKKYPQELLTKYDYYFASVSAAFDTGHLGIVQYVIVPDPVLSVDNSFLY
jgi:cyclopropane-fatty-acyl-phospholipid synthase